MLILDSPQFTLQYHQTPLLSTVTVKTRNSPNSSQVSSTNSAPTPSHLSESLPRVTSPCQRKEAKVERKPKMMTMMTLQIWLQGRTLRTRSNNFSYANGG